MPLGEHLLQHLPRDQRPSAQPPQPPQGRLKLDRIHQDARPIFLRLEGMGVDPPPEGAAHLLVPPLSITEEEIHRMIDRTAAALDDALTARAGSPVGG